jgi:hypothetical protein
MLPAHHSIFFRSVSALSRELCPASPVSWISAAAHGIVFKPTKSGLVEFVAHLKPVLGAGRVMCHARKALRPSGKAGTLVIIFSDCRHSDFVLACPATHALHDAWLTNAPSFQIPPT